MSTASANHDQPEPGPSSLGKRPHLEKRLTTVEEDTVSLGDDDDDPFSDMFDEIDRMVLDRYNVASMDLDAEAALFRQVPFACVLTETDMLPLHVRYTPALYIASSIAIICRLIVMHNLLLVRAPMTGMMHAAQAVRAKWQTKVSCLGNFGY